METISLIFSRSEVVSLMHVSPLFESKVLDVLFKKDQKVHVIRDIFLTKDQFVELKTIASRESVGPSDNPKIEAIKRLRDMFTDNTKKDGYGCPAKLVGLKEAKDFVEQKLLQ